MRIFVVVIAVAVIFTSFSALAEEEQMIPDTDGNAKKVGEDKKGVISLIFENDLFTGTDYGYTNGARLSYTSSEEGMPAYIRKASSYLPLLKEEGKKRISVAVGQNIFTPRDIQATEFIENDFLYAGWLYGSLEILSDQDEKFDNVGLTIGMVGPSSKAEQTQKYIHQVKGVIMPKGWNNQLKDEPGINFTYERKWRKIFVSELFGMGFDVMPHVGANLGNVNTSTATGATFRLGYDLPADYGPPRIHPNLSGSDFFIPTRKFSGYLFSTFEISAVARDIFLDGNTFKDSHSIEKRSFVKNLQLGGTLIYKDMRFSYTHVISTQKFKGQQDKYTQFGGITFSYRF